jgi:hypothetical protein
VLYYQLLLLFINGTKCPVCGLFGPNFDRAAFCSIEFKFRVFRDRVACISLADCKRGTIHELLFGGNTTIELKNTTISDNNDIWRGVYQLTSVPVLSAVDFFSSLQMAIFGLCHCCIQ